MDYQGKFEIIKLIDMDYQGKFDFFCFT